MVAFDYTFFVGFGRAEDQISTSINFDPAALPKLYYRQ